MKTRIKFATVVAAAFAMIGVSQAEPASKGIPGAGISVKARMGKAEKVISQGVRKQAGPTVGGPRGKRW